MRNVKKQKFTCVYVSVIAGGSWERNLFAANRKGFVSLEQRERESNEIPMRLKSCQLLFPSFIPTISFRFSSIPLWRVLVFAPLPGNFAS